MKINITNRGSTPVVIDLDGDESNHDTTILLGVKGTAVVEVDSSQLERLRALYPECSFR